MSFFWREIDRSVLPPPSQNFGLKISFCRYLPNLFFLTITILIKCFINWIFWEKAENIIYVGLLIVGRRYLKRYHTRGYAHKILAKCGKTHCLKNDSISKFYQRSVFRNQSNGNFSLLCSFIHNCIFQWWFDGCCEQWIRSQHQQVFSASQLSANAGFDKGLPEKSQPIFE